MGPCRVYYVPIFAGPWAWKRVEVYAGHTCTTFQANADATGRVLMFRRPR